MIEQFFRRPQSPVRARTHPRGGRFGVAPTCGMWARIASSPLVFAENKSIHLTAPLPPPFAPENSPQNVKYAPLAPFPVHRNNSRKPFAVHWHQVRMAFCRRPLPFPRYITSPIFGSAHIAAVKAGSEPARRYCPLSVRQQERRAGSR